MSGIFGEGNERLFEELNRAGSVVADMNGNAVGAGDRLRAYQAVPTDTFDFWVRRPEDTRRDGMAVSYEAIEGVAREIGLFIMARAQLRVDEGHPPDEILINVELQLSPEPPSPQHHGVEPLHRAGTALNG